MDKSFIRQLDDLSRALKRVPQAAAIEAVNFSKDRFRQQAWVDSTTQPWPNRKRSRGSKRRDRGAILVDSGRLKRSIRKVYTGRDRVIIGTDVPYAQAHNEGFKGPVTVKAHTRGRYEKVEESYRTRSGRSRTRVKQERTGEVTVKSHQRRMNLPQRQFMGNSEVLARNVERRVQLIFNKAMK